MKEGSCPRAKVQGEQKFFVELIVHLVPRTESSYSYTGSFVEHELVKDELNKIS
jgi:hypothetical protein